MTPSTRSAGWERVLLLVLLAAALLLRVRQIEDFFIGPDDGAYLHSAQVDVIEPGFDPVRWVKEDVAWVGWFAEHYGENTVTYPHSYLHQFVARYFFRLGAGSLQALRLSSAFTGVLTVFFAWWLFTLAWPERRRLGLLCAALVALAPGHVFFSRTGWGQVGFACFYLAYTALLYRVLFVIPADDARALRRAGWGLAACALLAFGWQEGVAPYIVGSGLMVLAAPFIAGEGEPRAERRLLSRRTWTYVWSAAPVGALTLALALFSPFAQKHWFEKPLPPGVESWLEMKSLTLSHLFVAQRVDLMCTWIVLALAPLGFLCWWRERRTLALHLAVSALAGTVILLVFFTDAWLVRAHMPLLVILPIFAAGGLAAIGRALAARVGHLASGIVGALVLATLALVSWTTLFGAVSSPLFVQHLYMSTAPLEKDFRDVDRPILEHLAQHLQPGERVGVFADKSAIFRLQDIGIRATEDYLQGPSDAWPQWVVAARKEFQDSPHTVARGGAYRLVIADTIDRWQLYERVVR